MLAVPVWDAAQSADSPLRAHFWRGVISPLVPIKGEGELREHKASPSVAAWCAAVVRSRASSASDDVCK